MNQQNGQNTNQNNPKQGGLSWSTPAKPAPAAPAPKQEASKHEPKQEKPQHKPAAASGAAAENNAAKIAAWLAGGVVVGVVVAWGATSFLRHAPSVSTTAGGLQNATSTAQGDQGLGQGSDPSLTVMSPQKAGTSVAIAKAIVSEPTWIVVQESVGGKPGNVLGAALFFPDHQAGTVELLRGTVAGQTYFVSKRLDNGDHQFSLKADQPVTENGQQLWVTFSAN